jgi:hypothetical protein
MPTDRLNLAPWWFFPGEKGQGANLTTWHPGSAGRLAAREARLGVGGPVGWFRRGPGSQGQEACVCCRAMQPINWLLPEDLRRRFVAPAFAPARTLHGTSPGL